MASHLTQLMMKPIMLFVCHYEDEDELRLVYQYYVQRVTYTQRCLCAFATAVYKDLCGICGISFELFSWAVDYRHWHLT